MLRRNPILLRKAQNGASVNSPEAMRTGRPQAADGLPVRDGDPPCGRKQVRDVGARISSTRPMVSHQDPQCSRTPPTTASFEELRIGRQTHRADLIPRDSAGSGEGVDRMGIIRPISAEARSR